MSKPHTSMYVRTRSHAACMHGCSTKGRQSLGYSRRKKSGFSDAESQAINKLHEGRARATCRKTNSQTLHASSGVISITAGLLAAVIVATWG